MTSLFDLTEQQGNDILAFARQAMAQANEINNNSTDDPEAVLEKLKTNDPTLKGLVIGPRVETLTYVLKKKAKPEKYLPKSEDEWIQVGEYIGAHDHIEDLELYMLNDENANDIENLLKGVAKNRSIKSIKFMEAYRAMFESTVAVMAPFFKHNKSLQKLDVDSCHVPSWAPFKMIASILREGSSLEEFHSMNNPRTLNMDGLDEIDSILCDTTSIEATKLSNHHFSKLAVYKDSEDGMTQRLIELPVKLEKSIELNKIADKDEVAREKVQCYHGQTSGNGKKREREEE